jgi:hypothetical protein
VGHAGEEALYLLPWGPPSSLPATGGMLSPRPSEHLDFCYFSNPTQSNSQLSLLFSQLKQNPITEKRLYSCQPRTPRGTEDGDASSRKLGHKNSRADSLTRQ